MGIALAASVNSFENRLSSETIGVIFKKARAIQNKSLETISDQLKIRRVFLEAIENEQFEQLPGGVYTVGFIRSYAKYLGLDHDLIIEQLKDEKFFQPISLMAVGDVEHFPNTRFVSSGMVIVGVLLFVFCVISAYIFFDDVPVHINWNNQKPQL
jgi:cytoskeleton protein RodZ